MGDQGPAAGADLSEPDPAKGLRRRLRTPLRVVLPSALTSEVRLPVGPATRAARVLTVVLPWTLVVVGLVLAVTSAVLAERESTEAAGTFGTELGAAMWFAGALTLGARRGATVGRALALVGLALGGALLVALAVLLGWSGAALSLAMEFGVGALAVAVIDVVLIGWLHGGLDRLGALPDEVVTVRLSDRPPWLVVDRRR